MAEEAVAEKPQPPISKDMRGVPDPVAAVQKILDAEKNPPPETQAQPEPEAGENKQVEGQEAPQEDAPRYASIPLDQLEAIELEVTVKGEDGSDVAEKRSVKDLREGYMRQKDYQRKTAEVARQRDAVAEQVRQAVESERTGMKQALAQLQSLVLEAAAPELKDVNWNDLAANNVVEYVRLRNRADQVLQAHSAIQAKLKEISDKEASEQAAKRKELLAKAHETLTTDIPGFGPELLQTLMKSGERHGFKPDEIQTWLDPRAIKLLHKAHLYDQLQAEKKTPPPEKKVVVTPKVVKPGPTETVNQKAQADQRAMKQLQGSGKIEDAAAVIRGRFAR